MKNGNMKDNPIAHALEVLDRMEKEQEAQRIAVLRGQAESTKQCPLNEGEWASLFLTSDRPSPIVLTQGGLSWVASKEVKFKLDVWGIFGKGYEPVLVLQNDDPFGVTGEIKVFQTPFVRHAQAYMALVAPFVTIGHDWLLPLGPIFGRCRIDYKQA